MRTIGISRESLDEKKKTKRQISLNKKKLKMKRKGASEKDHEATTKKEVDCAAKDIDDKFDMLFREVGLDIKEQAICKIKGDGACGSTCTGIRCHNDQTVGEQVRKNINQHLIDFWSFFKPAYKNVVFKHFHLKMKQSLKIF